MLGADGSASAGLVLGVYFFYQGFRLLQRKQFILNTPRSSVGAAALGPVEVTGKATGPYTLISPLSLADCFYYRLVVTYGEERKRKHRAVIEEFGPLFLDAGTGPVNGAFNDTVSVYRINPDNTTTPILSVTRPGGVGAQSYSFQLPDGAALDRTQWIALGFLSLFCSVLGYFAWSFALARVEASRASVCIYAEPVIAMALGSVLLKERYGAMAFAGAAAIAASIWFVARRPME